MGIDPTPLGQAPFTLATNERRSTAAPTSTSALPIARCYVGPCIAGHVGADTAAAILAEGPHRVRAMQLLVDVGTNAEIVLGDRPAVRRLQPDRPGVRRGPDQSGQRATAGAIERVRIDPDTLEPRSR